MVETMMAEINRLNGLAAKDSKHRNTYQQQSAQLFKLMKQIIHITAQMDDAVRNLKNEKSVLVNYLIANNIVTYDKLHELEAVARERAKKQNEKDSKELERLYGEAYSICQNKTKSNPTEKTALKNVR